VAATRALVLEKIELVRWSEGVIFEYDEKSAIQFVLELVLLGVLEEPLSLTTTSESANEYITSSSSLRLNTVDLDAEVTSISQCISLIDR
jgi:hypothetical protein